MSPGSTMVAFMIVSKVGKVGLMEGCAQIYFSLNLLVTWRMNSSLPRLAL
jgi:hypothetical protein